MINFGKSGGSGSGWKIGASTSLVRTVLKVPFEKAAPSPSVVLAPLPVA